MREQIINARLQSILELEPMPKMEIFIAKNGIKINITTRERLASKIISRLPSIMIYFWTKWWWTTACVPLTTFMLRKMFSTLNRKFAIKLLIFAHISNCSHREEYYINYETRRRRVIFKISQQHPKNFTASIFVYLKNFHVTLALVAIITQNASPL